MKYVKVLGLAAVAAAVLMTFVGAGTASATVLCTTVPNVEGTCPEGWALGVGAGYHAELKAGATATLTTNEAFKPNIVCNTSTVEGVVTVEGDATHTTYGHVSKLTFENCGESEVKVLEKGNLEVHWIPGTKNGTLTGSGQSVTTVTPSIFGNIHCIYTTNATDLGTVTGGEPAILTANSQALGKLVTSSLCPPAPTWDANYKVTNHFKLYVASIT